MLEQLLHIDEQLFFFINAKWTNAFFDLVLPIWRDKYLWIPLYVFFLILVSYNFPKRALAFILVALITVGISDTLSSKVLKKNVKRTRPCNTEKVAEQMILRVNCSPSYSFTSSHATNHFAIGFFFILSLGHILPLSRWLIFFWAASISYAQVYVGAHFPLDVIVGAILGTLIGMGTTYLFHKFGGKLNLDLV